MLKVENDNRIVAVNLGAGASIKKSTDRIKWVNLDMFDNEGIDVIQNLEEGLPCFENESVDVIFASHVLEHVKAWTYLMRECHRVLKPKGLLYLRVPERSCRAAIADPTHCNLFVNETWMHFHQGLEIGFDTLGMRQMGFQVKWNETINHYRNGIDDGVPGAYFREIVVDLEKTGEAFPWESVATKKTIDQVAI